MLIAHIGVLYGDIGILGSAEDVIAIRRYYGRDTLAGVWIMELYSGRRGDSGILKVSRLKSPRRNPIP